MGDINYRDCPYRECLVAHRGYQKLFPENTLLAHQQAIDAGALFLETDIMLSADLQPVLYHDPHLRRISGRPGKVIDLTFNELCSIPAYEPRRLGKRFVKQAITPLTSLVRLLKDNPEVTAYLEVKSVAIDFAGCAPTLASIATCAESVAEQCVLISSHYRFIAFARQQGWGKCGLVLAHWQDLSSAEITAIRPDIIFCKHQKVPRQAMLENINAEIAIYEIASPERALYWLKRGAGKIETFDFVGLLEGISRKGY